jgi:hypothetical protein
MVMPMMVFVAMVPKFGFIEQEEEQQAKQQCDEQVVRFHTRFKGFRQEVQKSSRKQSTRCQAEHVLRVAAHDAKAQPSRQPNAANTSGQGAQQNRQKSHANSYAQECTGHSPNYACALAP